jgi:hypothetical protein
VKQTLNKKIGRRTVMEDNKELVEETTENVEETTEETQEPQENLEEVETTEEDLPVEDKEEKHEEVFTKEQVDELIAKKLARKEAKIRKEYNNKYRKLENVVNAGLGTHSTDEAVTKLTEFYTSKGINIPELSNFDDDDIKTLGQADADRVISLGYDEIVEEVDRLNELGIENMSARDKVEFQRLATERQRLEDLKDLASIGVDADILDNKDFINYTEKLNPNLSLKEKYEMYLGTQPKKEINNMGSMKNTPVEKAVKDYYTRDEALRLTDDDYKKHPELYEIIEKSMYKWSK